MFSEDSKLRKALKWLSISLGVVFTLIVLAVLAFFSPGLQKRFFYFPQQKAAWEQIGRTRVEVGVKTGWNEYKGSIHSHSEISHDSEAQFDDIQASLTAIGSNFIMMSDHYVDGKADWSLGWKGDHGGILFIRGFEMDKGLMPWGLPDSTVFSAKDDLRETAKKIKELGGIVTYAHCEEKRDWDLPELQAMEVYNVHPTVNKYKNDKKWLWRMLTTVLTCFGTYPDQCFFTLYERPDEVLKKWDDLNIYRHIAGFAGNDTHQNSGIQGMYLPNGNLLICDTGHKITDKEQSSEVKLNFFTRGMLRMMYGPLEPNKMLFRYDLDKYIRSAKYVRTHLYAKNLTETELVEALRAGRGFLSFDMVADGTGFVYLAESGANKAMMGESIKMDPALSLKAWSPYPSKFALMKNGLKVDEQEGREYVFQPKEAGKYRLEVSLKVMGKDQLWLLTNPIEVTN